MSKHIKEEINDLEKVILSNLSNLFDYFESETGFYPESVNLTFHKDCAFGRQSKNILIGVEVKLGI